MAIISFSQVQVGSVITTTLDIDELKTAVIAQAPSDVYMQDADNWKKVQVKYEEDVGGQHFLMTFMTRSQLTGTLDLDRDLLSPDARPQNFKAVSVQISDYDGGVFIFDVDANAASFPDFDVSV